MVRREKLEKEERERRQKRDKWRIDNRGMRAGEDGRAAIACNQKQDSGKSFKMMLCVCVCACVCVCVCVLTDLVLLQSRDWLQKNTFSNYLERAPVHWEPHYIITTRPTHTWRRERKKKEMRRIRQKRKMAEGRRETKDEREITRIQKQLKHRETF